MYLQNHIQEISSFVHFPILYLPWLCPRPISNSQLHVLPHFHLCPIYLVVFKGSYNFTLGYRSFAALCLLLSQCPRATLNFLLQVNLLRLFLFPLTAFSLFGQALTRLVTVSYMCYHTSTTVLSTSSSSRGLTTLRWDISS